MAMTAWQTIALSLTGNVLALAALGWLAKSLLGSFLSKDIERHRAVLASESEMAIEKLRHELQMAAQERNIVFSKLHEKRAEAIAMLYGLLVEAVRLGASYASPMEMNGEPTKSDKYTLFANAYNELIGCFGKNRIYLPTDTCNKIDELTEQMRSAVIEMNVYMSQEPGSLGLEGSKGKMDAWVRSWNCFKDQVPMAKSALEKDLRSLLGEALA